MLIRASYHNSKHRKLIHREVQAQVSPVRNLHPIKGRVSFPKVVIRVTVAQGPVGVYVLRYPHLGGDVCRVGRGVVEIIGELVPRHLDL